MSLCLFLSSIQGVTVAEQLMLARASPLRAKDVATDHSHQM